MSLRVVLAGHNLDRDLLLEIRSLLEGVLRAETSPAREAIRERVREVLACDNWTPETIAAAYARVSRDPRSVTELRALARHEVDRARRSNEAIVYGLGHASVAEHAVFNFDVMGLSRLAVETLERRRLASFTEKSQRYIDVDEEWVVPSEVCGSPAESAFRALVAEQNRFYHRAHDRLLPAFLAEQTSGERSHGSERAAQGRAREDARYGLGLATTVQLGLTLNARSLEGLLARCAAHPLAEVRDLGTALHEAVGDLAPSLIKRTEPTLYLREARSRLAEAVAAVVPAATATPASAASAAMSGSAVPSAAVADSAGEAGMGEPAAPGAAFDPADSSPEGGVRLLGTTPDPDGALVAALLFAGGAGAMERCRAVVARLGPDDRRRVAWSHLSALGPHDAVLREYELVAAEFEVVASAACYAQLKRHRMATMVALPYDPDLGLTVPDSMERAGLGGDLRRLADRATEVWRSIDSLAPPLQGARLPNEGRPAAAYALVNAQRRRVVVRMNARELHHFSRLREDVHAQWDIRRLAAQMLALARERMPITLALAGGKDWFASRQQEVFPGWGGG
jgi:flavin-dependent thymidylate synthase